MSWEFINMVVKTQEKIQEENVNANKIIFNVPLFTQQYSVVILFDFLYVYCCLLYTSDAADE